LPTQLLHTTIRDSDGNDDVANEDENIDSKETNANSESSSEEVIGSETKAAVKLEETANEFHRGNQLFIESIKGMG
jgi:hypothetical protein